jgi:hypothetical protein
MIFGHSFANHRIIGPSVLQRSKAASIVYENDLLRSIANVLLGAVQAF